MEDKKLFFYGAAHSLGVLAYVSLVVLFMSNAQNIFGKGDNFMTGIIILLVFILSALITGSLVLGKPALLYLDGKKAEAIKLLFYTIISLFILLLLAISGMLLLK
ncbi:MAG: hypothetical protein Q8O59_03880 [bacterium]|nr:hypothetical protein [bacterium]